ncbi:uncharacterized protein [Penaeus vannamei]|uniref:uncharacterized protein n=1 Tax=Penaeus vannamei TaxID=6689 RepID=UPI00387F4B86
MMTSASLMTHDDKCQPHDTYEDQCQPAHGLLIKREKDEVEYKETPECSERKLHPIQGVFNIKTSGANVEERSVEDIFSHEQIINSNKTISIVSLSCLKRREGNSEGLNLKTEIAIGENAD